ncbi:hypothetical protein ACFWXK_04810 [Streptomyces sp. NPDC059070]|uniref:hypothetical protein n=1 Tax=unclassified Streptomyces TaxID=2593676 RepID=UPI0034E24180
MGIESDQLVYDYLSRVGDLAQQRQLPSGTRMRLVTSLRDEIDRSRAKFAGDSPAAVRRILGRLGTPDEVVETVARDGAYEAPPEVEAAGRGVPGQRGGGRGLPKLFPRPRASAPAAAEPEPPAPRTGASPPHLAGMDELGPQDGEPDWWRVEPGPFAGGPGETVAGFVGGVEIPEILRPPVKEETGEGAAEGAEEAEEEFAEEDGAEAVEAAPARPNWRALIPGGPARPRARPLTNPLLLLSAALLVGGAVLGNWFALGGGWLLAYVSRRLTPAESKWAVMGLPGLTLAGGLVWLWGRHDGRWGEPIPDGGTGDAMHGLWPWLVRIAALSSAAFVVWRSQRSR